MADRKREREKERDREGGINHVIEQSTKLVKILFILDILVNFKMF